MISAIAPPATRANRIARSWGTPSTVTPAQRKSPKPRPHMADTRPGVRWCRRSAIRTATSVRASTTQPAAATGAIRIGEALRSALKGRRRSLQRATRPSRRYLEFVREVPGAERARLEPQQQVVRPLLDVRASVLGTQV